jgi:hypothetical protein
MWDGREAAELVLLDDTLENIGLHPAPVNANDNDMLGASNATNTFITMVNLMVFRCEFN